MATLKQSATELLLYVPFAERDRAKKIEGRRWDPDRRCWIYRRTRRALDEILREFGDEIDGTTSDLRGLPIETIEAPEAIPPITRALPGNESGSPSERADPSLRDDAQTALRSRIVELESALRRSGSEIERNKLEIAVANDRIRFLEGSLADLTKAHDTAVKTAKANADAGSLGKDRRIAQLEGSVSKLQAERDELKSTHKTIIDAQREAETNIGRRDQRIRELEAHKDALESSIAESGGLDGGLHEVIALLFPGDSGREDLVRSIRTGEDLSARWGITLETRLRRALHVTERTPLFDLINQSGEANILTQEALDLAHLVRKQRNRAVHAASVERRPTASAIVARNLLAVSAMRLVLGELMRISGSG